MPHGPDSSLDFSDGSVPGEDLYAEGDDEDTRTVVNSPTTKLSYDISGLDSDTQSEVRQLFRETPASDPPSLVLQWCQFSQEQDDSQFYAFQLHEIVPRSIRIGSPSSKYRSPRCNCMADNDKPCRHLIYLLDQINYFSSDHLPDDHHQSTAAAPAPASNQLFEQISNYHLDMLAGNLHCGVGSPESTTETNPVRLAEAREILATVARSDGDDYAVRHFRPDIFEDRAANSLLGNNGIISYSDLTATVAQMLITHNDFFAYFLKLLDPTSKARDPFRKIHQHIERVLRELDRYYARDAAAAHQQQTAAAAAAAAAAAETERGPPSDVPWAAAHLRRAVSRIQHLLQHRQDAPSPAERASAARALVRILYTVVFDWNRNLDHQNLYQELIGSPSSSPSSAFVLDTLAQLPEQNQWIETLEQIEAQLGTYVDGGAPPPPSFMRRLRDLVALMRSSRPRPPKESSHHRVAASGSSSSGLGSKRSSVGEGSGRDGGAKRMR